MSTIYKGEIIQCPGCKSDLFRFNRDLNTGDKVYAAALDAFPGIRPPKDYTPMNCPECGEAFGRGFIECELHIKDLGWYGFEEEDGEEEA